MVDWTVQLRKRTRRLWDGGLALLFPRRCAFCREELVKAAGDGPFCRECLERLAPAVWHGCRHCAGEVLDVGFLPSKCLLCRDVSLGFDAAVALGSYHKGLRRVVLRMKRPTHEALTLAMGRLLVLRRREPLLEHRPDVAVPVPMFWGRRLVRGVNGPDLLAEQLGRSLEIPVRRNVLVRRRNTQPQALLPPTRRFQNVRGAFEIRRGKDLTGARVLLIDDVLTTGATCSEAAKTLKQAGAASVVVAVVARAQGRE